MIDVLSVCQNKCGPIQDILKYKEVWWAHWPQIVPRMSVQSSSRFEKRSRTNVCTNQILFRTETTSFQSNTFLLEAYRPGEVLKTVTQGFSLQPNYDHRWPRRILPISLGPKEYFPGMQKQRHGRSTRTLTTLKATEKGVGRSDGISSPRFCDIPTAVTLCLRRPQKSHWRFYVSKFLPKMSSKSFNSCKVWRRWSRESPMGILYSSICWYIRKMY
jgi:hypothetical protein